MMLILYIHENSSTFHVSWNRKPALLDDCKQPSLYMTCACAYGPPMGSGSAPSRIYMYNWELSILLSVYSQSYTPLIINSI